MQLTKDNQEQLYRNIATTLIDHAAELTELDQAIGDGDHGINMKRGFEAVLSDVDEIATQPLSDALKKLGMTLVMKVGGASGPLYGTLFMEMGKHASQQMNLSQFGESLRQSCEGVKKRGKSDIGAKTMLDVLVPVAEALTTGASADEVITLAQQSAEATVPMLASRGRASFLKERSIGHMDPGARSSQLIINTVCEFYKLQAED